MKQKRLQLYIFGVFAFASAARLAAELPETTLISGTLTPGLLGQADTTTVPVQPAVTPGPPAPALAPEPSFWDTLTTNFYIQTSYTWNVDRTKVGTENLGRVFDTNSNEFMLNAVELYIGRGVSEDRPVGFLVDALVGQNADIVQSAGLFDDPDGEHLDLVQANIQLYLPWTGGKLTLGKFVTLAGAEVIDSRFVDQISRSFLFGFAIPFTHTGALYTQALPWWTQPDGDSILSLQGGIVNGWDVVKDNNESKTILTNLTFSPCDQFTLANNFFYSFSEQGGDEENGRTLFDIVATIPLKGLDNEELDNLKYVGNFDWGGEEGAAADGGYAQWWGFASGLRYDFKLTGDARNWFTAVRGEYFDDSDGARLPGALNGDKVWELTFTLGHIPWKFLQLRGEIRYDKADGQDYTHRSGPADRSHLTTFAFDAMFIF